jgi:hypothetical protein
MPDADATVLVIDDDPNVRASVGRLLRSLRIAVQLFASIADFLASDPPDRPRRGPRRRNATELNIKGEQTWPPQPQ